MEIGPNAFISTLNTKFICKANFAIVENLTVYTGYHTRVICGFVSDITEIKCFGHMIMMKLWNMISRIVPILSVVTIGFGTIISASSVFAKSIPPYGIYA